jgi:hypothetical protein
MSLVNQFKSATFLTSALQIFITVDATNASHGILTSWNSTNLKLLSSMIKPFSISSKFESQTNDSILWITNVYGPNSEEDRPNFFQELKNLKDQIQDPWLLTGDFNSV